MFAAFDADGDGYLRERDFAALVDRWSGSREWAPGRSCAHASRHC